MGLLSNQVVGLQLAPTGVRALGLQIGRKPKLTAIANNSLSPESFTKDGGLANQSAVGQMIASTLNAADPKPLIGAPLYLSLSEANVFRKLLELPLSVSASELESVVKTEIAEFLPGSLETTEISVRMIGRFGAPLGLVKALKSESEIKADRIEGNEVGRQLVSIVAVDNQIIQDYMAAAEEAGVRLMAIDTRAAALARAIYFMERDKAKLSCIIDCEGSRVVVSLHYKGIIWATGVVAGVEESSESRRFWTAIVDEVDRARKFFHNRSNRLEELEVAWVTGEFQDRAVAVQELQRLLDCKVGLARPAAALGDSLSELKDEYLGALGSALYNWFDND